MALCSDLGTPLLRFHMLCRLDHLVITERAATTGTSISFPHEEFGAAVHRGCTQIRTLRARAGMNRAAILRHQTGFVNYFIRAFKPAPGT
jgi:hypothetical protein